MAGRSELSISSTRTYGPSEFSLRQAWGAAVSQLRNSAAVYVAGMRLFSFAEALTHATTVR